MHACPRKKNYIKEPFTLEKTLLLLWVGLRGGHLLPGSYQKEMSISSKRPGTSGSQFKYCVWPTATHLLLPILYSYSKVNKGSYSPICVTTKPHPQQEVSSLAAHISKVKGYLMVIFFQGYACTHSYKIMT